MFSSESDYSFRISGVDSIYWDSKFEGVVLFHCLLGFLLTGSFAGLLSADRGGFSGECLLWGRDGISNMLSLA